MKSVFQNVASVVAGVCGFGLIVTSPKTKKQHIWAGIAVAYIIVYALLRWTMQK